MKPRVNLLATATKYNHFTSNRQYEQRAFSISNSVFFSYHASQFHAFRSPYTLHYIHSIHTHIYTQAFPHTWLWLVGWNIMALLFVFMCGVIMFCCWTITPKSSHNIHPTFLFLTSTSGQLFLTTLVWQKYYQLIGFFICFCWTYYPYIQFRLDCHSTIWKYTCTVART